MVVKDIFVDSGFDILVNNVGFICCEDVIEFLEIDWDDVMDVNVKVLFFMCQVFVKLFIVVGKIGKIVNIVFLLLFQGGICVFSYIVLKYVVVGLIKLMVNEWVVKGINVNVIVLGYIVINNIEVLCNDLVCNQVILEWIFVGWWGDVDDIV